MKKADNPPMPEWAKYVAEEQNTELWCYEEFPIKQEYEGVWRPFSGRAERCLDYDNVYWAVRWSDDDPTLISTYQEELRRKSSRNTFASSEKKPARDNRERSLTEIYDIIDRSGHLG